MCHKPHFACYNITLKNLIDEKHRTAYLYTAAARKLSGDKRELMLRLAGEEQETEEKLKKEYIRLFSYMPDEEKINPEEASVKELAAMAVSSAVHLSHMCLSAPDKKIADLLKESAEKSLNQGYLLLLTIQ